MRNLTYKSIDVMKKSKDVITAQLPLQEKQNLVQCLASAGANTIAISVPMDDSGVFPLRGIKVQPKKIEAETQEWCDVIHQQGLKVMHRGTFCGVENIYNMPFDQNTPMGNAASAQRDGSGTWCGRWFRYLYNHVGTHVVQGDIFAPIPEGATHAFDGHWFAKSRDAYAQMFIDFHAILNAYAASRGISLVFMMQENFSEVASGWMPRNVLQDAGVVALDYYGQRTNDQANKPADYVNDWTKL